MTLPVVFRQGPRTRGDVYLGYRPMTGNPTDAEGRLILVHHYGPAPRSRGEGFGTAEPAGESFSRPVNVSAQGNRPTCAISQVEAPELPPRRVRRGVTIEETRELPWAGNATR